MPKYRIQLTEWWGAAHEVIIDADSPEEAQQEAQDLAEQDSEIDMDMAKAAGLEYYEMENWYVEEVDEDEEIGLDRLTPLI